MGITSSKELKRKVNESTSNSSLSNVRYVITEKPKWKVFKKREVTAIPAYHSTCKSARGCPCGSNIPCKQKVTPRGVTIHYPQKKKIKTLAGRSLRSAKIDKGYLNTNPKPITNFTKLYRPKKFPTWRLDKIAYNTPYLSTTPRRAPKTETSNGITS